MFLKNIRLTAMLGLILMLLIPAYTQAGKGKKSLNLPQGQPVLWQDPGNISSKDLYHGPGSKETIPTGSFKFIKDDTSGSQPKFIIEDSQGVRWKVKLGREAQPETAATRLLWAVGYFTDETYYLPKIYVEGIEKYQNELMPSGGVIRGVAQGARLERVQQKHKIGSWSWFDNPFVNTKELDGLKVMMAFINNWDLKRDNNVIYYDEAPQQLHYYVHDLGGTFGKTGGDFDRSRNNLADYEESRFIETTNEQDVDFFMRARPPWFFRIHKSYYQEYANVSKVVKGIPRTHAKWIGGLLAQLSHRQLADAFYAANYQPAEVERFVEVLESRIRQLNQL
ncbi:MAG: hypothetical protein AB1489_24805 [Acidobacteriota bacterium]